MSEKRQKGVEYDREFIMKELKENGYVVLKNVVSAEKCEEIKNDFLEYMEKLEPDFKKDDKSTWTNDVLPFRTRGLLQHFKVGTQPHAVKARDAVKHVFETIWETDKLLTSFDGTSFAMKPKVCKMKNLQDWIEKTEKVDPIHIDQTTEGFSSVQGGLAVVNQSENCKVFLVVPKSHLYHHRLMRIAQKEQLVKTKEKYDQVLKEMNQVVAEMEKERTAELDSKYDKLEKKKKVLEKEIPMWNDTHWLILSENMKESLKRKGLKRVRVPMEAGDFVLWDSRCVHSSSDFTKEADPTEFRLQVFVSMAPVPADAKVYKKEIEKRKKYWEKGVTTKHSAQILRPFPLKPFVHAGQKIADFTKIESYNELTPEQQKLHGLIAYE